jgi:hypothetical protein
LIDERVRTSDAVRARPLWQLLGGFGISAGVIDWPLTFPADGESGYVISDEFLRRDDSSLLASLAGEPALAWPPDLIEAARESRRRALSETADEPAITGRPIVRLPGEGLATQLNPLTTDAIAERLAGDLAGSRPVQFSAVRYPGIDAVGHYYLRYAMPRAFGDVSDEERLQHGRVLEQYYTYVDGLVGRAMRGLGPDDLLLVVSGFGMEPLSLGKRVLERIAGDPELSGSHERAPDGFMIAYGRSVAKGHLPRASVLDVAPTVMYFLGLPIARDFDGYARTDIFARAFTEQRPITFIPSYDR